MPQHDETRLVSLGQIMNMDEAHAMIAMIPECDDYDIFRKRVRDEFIQPNHKKIEASIGEFDDDYLAYVVSHQVCEFLMKEMAD